MKKFDKLCSKTYSYLKDNNDDGKKAKGTKKCAVKRKLKFEEYKKCLKSSQIINIVHYLEKKEIDVDSLIALSSNDDKRMQSIDSVETYPFGMIPYNLLWERENNKRFNYNRKIQKCSTLITFQRKT